MNLTARAGAALRHWALSASVGAAVLTVFLSGLGFLTAAFYIWVAKHIATAQAAAITGGMLFLLALLISFFGMIIVRKLKKPQPSLLSEFGGTIGMGARLVGMLVRRDPRKAVVLAAVAGAIAEYVTSDTKKSK